MPPPRGDLNGLQRYWRSDLLAGFLVFLIALPLCLGIAIASGAPPTAGILTAIVGGLVASLISDSELTIKGPAAGLIVIVLGAIGELGGGDPVLGYHRMLAVGVIAGVLQAGLGLLRAGKLGDFFPTAAVHGMLAAIGVIIISKQIHVAFGVSPHSKEPLSLLLEIPESVAHMNPEISMIGVLSFLAVVSVPFLPIERIKKLPGPLIALALAIPVSIAFDLAHQHTYAVGSAVYDVGPTFLVSLPTNFVEALAFPDFSVATSATSLKYVIMFLLVGSLESLLSAKAIDLLDPHKRQADLDRDLLAVGVANTCSSLIGGLPMISEIVRSSANINYGAKTRFSNAFHGLFLLVLVAAAPGLLNMIPLAALAAMLIYAGIRLASPAEFIHMWAAGKDQFAVFMVTLVMTLAVDLLVGVFVGVLLELAIQLFLGAGVRHIIRPMFQRRVIDDDTQELRLESSASFSNWIAMKAEIGKSTCKCVILDLSGSKVVDHTAQCRLAELQRQWNHEGRHLRIVGLDAHECRSSHPHGLRILGRRVSATPHAQSSNAA